MSAQFCMAVGAVGGANYASYTLAETWHGQKWSKISPPSPGTDSAFYSASCANQSECLAVGNTQPSGGKTVPLAANWNGQWAQIPVPHPAGLAGSGLEAVACLDAPTFACFAAGGGVGSGGKGGKAIVERYGGLWSVMKAATPAGANDPGLAAISCPSEAYCMAVGGYQDAVHDSKPMAEYWSGGAWELVPVPLPAKSQGSFNGISCPSASDCLAVGSYATRSGGYSLAERWDGKTWSIVPSPDRSVGKAPFTVLFAVSCAQAASCEAVGDYSVSPTSTAVLAVRYHGGSFTVQHAPNPPGTSNKLSGISCPSPVSCLAVGSLSKGYSPVATLAERWSQGRWTRVPSA